VSDTGILDEARTLIGAVLGLHPDIGVALERGIERGFLDVPYCLHPDNPGRTRSRIDAEGRLGWSDSGSLPIRRPAWAPPRSGGGSSDLLTALNFVRNRYDQGAGWYSAVGGTKAVTGPETEI
jgi:methylaspartate mutase epsilon subunit